MELPEYLEKPLDEIDASVFSSDVLHNKEALERFKYFLGRWGREVESIEDLIAISEREAAQIGLNQ